MESEVGAKSCQKMLCSVERTSAKRHILREAPSVTGSPPASPWGNCRAPHRNCSLATGSRFGTIREGRFGKTSPFGHSGTPDRRSIRGLRIDSWIRGRRRRHNMTHRRRFPPIHEELCHLRTSGIPSADPCMELLTDSPKVSVPYVVHQSVPEGPICLRDSCGKLHSGIPGVGPPESKELS